MTRAGRRAPCTRPLRGLGPRYPACGGDPLGPPRGVQAVSACRGHREAIRSPVMVSNEAGAIHLFRSDPMS
jgi:hypothetical protein